MSFRKNHEPSLPPKAEVDRLVSRTIEEDLGRGDITTRTAIDPLLRAKGWILAGDRGIFAGGPVAKKVFQKIDPTLRVKLLLPEGRAFRKGEKILRVEGKAQSILMGERVALNFLQQLCAVATETAKIVASVRGTGVSVLATRKTVPGLRALQKYAVQVGGGLPHRKGLFDEVLLKENHIDMAREDPTLLVKKVRAAVPSRMMISAEARNLEEAKRLVLGGADRILLDNMTPVRLRQTVSRLRAFAKEKGREIEIEASGGICLENARAFALTGVDRISIGALTHSIRAIDLSLDLVPIGQSVRGHFAR